MRLWGVAAIAPWFRLRLPSCGPKHTIYAFFNLYRNCNEKRMKINKKEAGMWPFFKKTAYVYESVSITPVQICSCTCISILSILKCAKMYGFSSHWPHKTTTRRPFKQIWLNCAKYLRRIQVGRLAGIGFLNDVVNKTFCKHFCFAIFSKDISNSYAILFLCLLSD